MSPEELRARLDALCGREGEPLVSRDPVNQPMIRHWCDAVGDRNPCYTDPDFAEKSVHGAIVAPPTMLQAWTMPGLAPPGEGPPRASDLGAVLSLLDEIGADPIWAPEVFNVGLMQEGPVEMARKTRAATRKVLGLS